MGDYLNDYQRDVSEKEKQKKQTQMRYIERQFDWTGESWQFDLAEFFREPIAVYSWFRKCNATQDTIQYFGDQGLFWFSWVYNAYRPQLYKAGFKFLEFDGKKIPIGNIKA